MREPALITYSSRCTDFHNTPLRNKDLIKFLEKLTKKENTKHITDIPKCICFNLYIYLYITI